MLITPSGVKSFHKSGNVILINQAYYIDIELTLIDIVKLGFAY